MDTISEISIQAHLPPTNVASELAALWNQLAQLITQNVTQQTNCNTAATARTEPKPRHQKHSPGIRLFQHEK